MKNSSILRFAVGATVALMLGACSSTPAVTSTTTTRETSTTEVPAPASTSTTTTSVNR